MKYIKHKQSKPQQDSFIIIDIYQLQEEEFSEA